LTFFFINNLNYLLYSIHKNGKPSDNALNKPQSNNIIITNKDDKEKKAIIASSNSLASSQPFSEDFSTASGMGREMHRKINYK